MRHLLLRDVVIMPAATNLFLEALLAAAMPNVIYVVVAGDCFLVKGKEQSKLGVHKESCNNGSNPPHKQYAHDDIKE